MDYYTGHSHDLPLVQNWAAIAPYEPPKSSNVDQRRTAFLSPGGLALDFFSIPEKGPGAPTALAVDVGRESEVDRYSPPVVGRQLSPAVDVASIAKQRVELLNSSYKQGPHAAEITARLKILNSRLAEALPRVSIEQVALLEVAAASLERSRSSLEARAQRLGIAI